MPPNYKKSRLDRIAEQKGYKKLVVSVVAGLIVFISLLYFGVPALISMSSFISSLNKNYAEPVKNTDASIIMPPNLEPFFEATNSSPISVKGIADPKVKVELFLNGDLTDNTETSENGVFEFNDILLKQGNNSLYAIVVSNNKYSDKSQIYSVFYKKSLPKLEILKPENDSKVTGDKKIVEIAGNTDTDSNITVNDHLIVVNSDGTFGYSYPLNDGDNLLKIVATDPAGNQTAVERNVNYSL